MKKQYQKPEITLESFYINDVITSSSDPYVPPDETSPLPDIFDDVFGFGN